MKRTLIPLLALLLAGCVTTADDIANRETAAAAPADSASTPAAPAQATEPAVVTLNSPSPLIEVRFMVRAGSTADPAGREGLAALVADAVLQGGFGDPASPVTKERLAEITQPWGEGALPSVRTSFRTTTFAFTVPRDVLDQYIATVMRPMLTQPLFASAEIERLATEATSAISAARYEDLENLGLAALDQFVLSGTPYAHQPIGTEAGIKAITRDDVVSFYRNFYRPGNLIIGVSTNDTDVVSRIRSVATALNADVSTPVPQFDAVQVTMPRGREVIIVDEPNAPAASVHLGFPLTVNRAHPDFWPLYVANVWLGTHRDSYGRLYQLLREERGYNYGNYSYIEYFANPPGALFPPFNTPREQQTFSIWLRPVAHEYAYPLMKAATYELDRLASQGMTAEEVAGAKNKAKVLYVNLAETVGRLLEARMDDAFFGMTPGYLESYLARIDGVTADQVNAAIRRHLQTGNLRYVVVTNSGSAATLAQQIRADRPAYGKGPKEYEIQEVKLPDGSTVLQVPPEKLDVLRLDAVWANYPLRVREVRTVPVTQMFADGAGLSGAGSSGAGL